MSDFTFFSSIFYQTITINNHPTAQPFSTIQQIIGFLAAYLAISHALISNILRPADPTSGFRAYHITLGFSPVALCFSDIVKFWFEFAQITHFRCL